MISRRDGPHAIARRGVAAGRAGAALPVDAPDEVLLFVRLHWAGLAGRLLLPAAVGVLSAAIVLAGAVFPPLGLLCLGVAAAWGAAVSIGWASASLTLTARDLVLDDGVLPRVSVIIPLDSVHLVTCRQSLGGRLLGYGMLEVDLISARTVRFSPVASPQRLRACIMHGRLRCAGPGG